MSLVEVKYINKGIIDNVEGESYMKIEYSCTGGKLVIELYPESDEYSSKNKAKLGRKSCEIRLPLDWDLTKVHPDALALATIFLVYPFCNKKLELSIGISPFFAQKCEEIIKKEVGPINPLLSARETKKTDKMALAYSGGVDSTAAVSIIPKESPLFFIDRIMPEGETSMYKKEAAYRACEEMRKKGHKVYEIETDFEYIREPIGFPVDLACCIPAILMSDYEGIDSIAAGMIMESAYKIGHEKYIDYVKSWHYSVWGSLCKAAQLPLSLVTAGLSEVATTLIASRSEYMGIAESCMRGLGGNPCMKCMKCFRKGLLDEVLQIKDLSEENIARFFLNPGAYKTILYTPMKHQNVMAYIMKHYSGTNKTVEVFKEKMGTNRFELDYLEKWYAPAIEVIAPRYQDYVSTKMREYVPSMSINEMMQMASWDLEEFWASEDYQKATVRLRELL